MVPWCRLLALIAPHYPKSGSKDGTDEAATKLIFLVIRNFEKDGRNVRERFAARNLVAIMFELRFNA